MNGDQIEKLLRAAPRVLVPTGLQERLEADIHLPPKRRLEPVEEHVPSLLKRWLPALSVAIWFLGCLVILGVQSRSLTQLRKQNEALRAAAAEAQQTPAAAGAEAELTRLRSAAEEAQKLRTEIAQAAAQLKELKRLRADIQRMSAQELKMAQAASSVAVQPEQDFFGKADRIKCVNNLKQLGLGARMWANDHNHLMPTSFDQMQNELPNKSVLSCPAGGETAQYQLISPGTPETDPQVVFAYCPFHNNAGLCDGSVQQLGQKFRLVVREDGKTVIGR